MGGGQKSKFSDFTQNDFSGRFRRFPEKKKLWVKILHLELFSKKKFPKNASEIDFIVTSQNDTCVDGYQHGSDFFQIGSKTAEWRPF